jgi:hypothetical protein
LLDKHIITRALWFMNQEIERILGDLERGVLNKDQAIGSLTTIFNIASGVEDVNYMQNICRIIGYIRNTDNYFQIKKKYYLDYLETSPQ